MNPNTSTESEAKSNTRTGGVTIQITEPGVGIDGQPCTVHSYNAKTLEGCILLMLSKCSPTQVESILRSGLDGLYAARTRQAYKQGRHS